MRTSVYRAVALRLPLRIRERASRRFRCSMTRMRHVVAVAVVLSVVTAFLYALSNVLELLEAEQVPDEYAAEHGLMARLVRRPRWLLGLLADVGGYVTQAAALALAAVVFVEPILAFGVLLALLLAAGVHAPKDPRARLDRRGGPDDRTCGVPLRGLTDRRHRRRADQSLDHRRTADRRGRRRMHDRRALDARSKRAALLGVAAGVSFGVSALLTKALMHYFGDGIFAFVPHWEPYALAVTAIGGVVIARVRVPDRRARRLGRFDRSDCAAFGRVCSASSCSTNTSPPRPRPRH